MEIPKEFNEMLHYLRGRELRSTAPVCGTMLSVGCSDLYYFEWIESNLGHVDIHIGLEFYRPQPENLPENVRWIQNTAGDMRDVSSRSVDLVFAGQTIEHLWYEELAGFFIESARVLKAGGRLLFDSPNRFVSNALRWNHPEHTIELLPDEAIALARLAGFDVVKCVGHWLCQDPDTGAFLALTDVAECGPLAAERRINDGFTRPEHSFSWWLETRRTDREVDVVGVYNFARRLSKAHFAERISKIMLSQIAERKQRGGMDWVVSPAGWQGALVFGPYAPLPPGDWIIRFCLDPYEALTSPGKAEVFQMTTQRVLSETALPVRFTGGWVDVPLRNDETLFGLEYRLWSNGSQVMSAMVGVEVLLRGIA